MSKKEDDAAQTLYAIKEIIEREGKPPRYFVANNDPAGPLFGHTKIDKRGQIEQIRKEIEKYDGK